MNSAPPSRSDQQRIARLAADIVAVVRLSVLVDVVAIAAGIAIILLAVDAAPITPPRIAPATAPPTECVAMRAGYRRRPPHQSQRQRRWLLL